MSWTRPTTRPTLGGLVQAAPARRRAVHPGDAVSVAGAGGGHADCDTTGCPTAAVTFSRRNIFKRDKFTCQYCGNQPGSEELTLDHVVPRVPRVVSRGGTTACWRAWTCNKRKADRTPKQAGMRLRKEPVRPTWNPPLYAAHECGSKAGRSSSARRTGTSSWRSIGDLTTTAPGLVAGSHYTSVLLGEQPASKTGGRGSTPRARA